jgi:hypothetical protein
LVVYRNDLEVAAVLALVQRPQNVAADPPITIDANFDRHECPALKRFAQTRHALRAIINGVDATPTYWRSLRER